MKKCIVLLIAVSMMTLGLTATAADKLVIKSSDVHGDGYPTVEAIKYMGELLDTWTNGRITIQVFGSMQLGGEKEALEQVQVGALEMTRVSVGVVGPIVDEFNAFNLPYVFRSSQHMYNVTDGEIGTELLQKLEKGGLIGLGYMDAGSRSFYNSVRPIKSIDDLDGLKIRVMQNPIFVEMVNAMGGNGIPVAFNELYTAMQTGVVDGAENNPPTVIHQKHYEVAKYYTLTEHLMVPEIFVFSKKVWDTLSETDQLLIRKAAALTVPKERELWKAMVDKALNELSEMGYNVIKEIDKEPFIKATEPVRVEFGSKYLDLIKRIQAVEG
ncbi:DctP family TRAP transporter solute-binding subunit [candidate division KSB3 bacterium]|uniref:DctP family TRAP transporter solute-binding subunit n=1 Tax=candidate division KSB3 bacterium TaxID=2044937 RepID=A0A9D5JXW4_9BACT|nr:DctP family TRAP transporter solute-binding subunit [candidate division KSB3 bacterium]MBD3326327.1 DctP family TRAP transporter solute-binding subunit [candidate division KSB3 bacterium]